jgi:hypothetical protein
MLHLKMDLNFVAMEHKMQLEAECIVYRKLQVECLNI